MSQAVAAGAQVLGSAFQAAEEHRKQKALARADEENARLTELQGEQGVLETMREERQVSGAAIAAQASSGLGVGTGSAADILIQNAVEREVEIQNIRHEAAGQARNYRVSARDHRRAARNAVITGVLNAAGAGLSYASDTASRKTLDQAVKRSRKADLLGSGAYRAGGQG